MTFALVPTDDTRPATAERPSGLATLTRIDTAHGSTEIGSGSCARSLQRTSLSTLVNVGAPVAGWRTWTSG